MTVTAVVTCTHCAKKFVHKSADKYGWGDLVTVRCPDGHLSKDILSKYTSMDSNTDSPWSKEAIAEDHVPTDDELHVAVTFDNGDDPELAPA